MRSLCYYHLIFDINLNRISQYLSDVKKLRAHYVLVINSIKFRTNATKGGKSVVKTFRSKRVIRISTFNLLYYTRGFYWKRNF